MIAQTTLHRVFELRYKRRKRVSVLVKLICSLFALIALFPLFCILYYVTIRAIGSINLEFFMELPKPVGEAGGGMGNSLLGSVILLVLASLVGIPWGLATGIYLSEYGQNKVGAAVRFATDMLSSVPSIIVGLFVYTLLVMPMHRFSAIAGGIALAIIMIPTMARSTEELLKLVPAHIREAGLALGFPRWRMLLKIVLRGQLGAIGTAMILALARVAGETAPLLFTALNNRFWSIKLDQPISSLPVQIYTYAISPFENWHKQAWAAAFVLMMFVLVVNLLTRFILANRQTGGKFFKR